MGDSGTQSGVFVRGTEEVHNLLQLFLFLVGTGHIVEGDLFVVRHPQHCPGLTELGHGIAAAVHPAHQEGPKQQQYAARHQQGQDKIIGGVALVCHKVIDLQNPGGHLLIEELLHFRPEPCRVCKAGGDGGFAVVGSAEDQGDVVPFHQELGHLLPPEQLHQIGVGDGVGFLAEFAQGPAEHQQQNHQVDQRYDIPALIFQWRISLFFINVAFQNAYIGQVAILLVVVQAVANHKGIGHREAHIVRLQGDAGLPAFRLIQQGADFQ